MSRQTWKKGNLYISFGKPSITPYYDNEDEREVQSMNDVMYFYYDITILQDNKTMFEAGTHDFPKVQNLPVYIDEIMNFDMSKAYMLEDYEDNGFNRRIRYHQVILDDCFGFDIEYFYKIERYDYYVKQRHDDVAKEWTEYVLTIGQIEVDKIHGGSNREDYGKCIVIKYLTVEDLNRLKDTAENFCKVAIEEHNRLEEMYKEDGMI